MKNVKKCFSIYGKIKNCHFVRNIRRSHAFITFNDVPSAIRALKDGRDKKIKLHNKILKVKVANFWNRSDCTKQRRSKKKSAKKYIQKHAQNYSTNISIDMLNDYCLKYIFQFLIIDDRTRIERVSKRWKTLSRESWHSIKKLDKPTWTRICRYSCITQTMLQIVLQKCSRYLTQIDLSIIHRYDLPALTLAKIINLCPNLTSINAGNYKVSTTDLDLLTRKYKNITELKFIKLLKCVTDEHLKNVFKKYENLKLVSIWNNGTISGKCLLHLPVQTMRTLEIGNCRNVTDDEFSAALARLENLERVTMYPQSNIGQKTVNVIHCCKNLRKIYIFDNCEQKIHMNIRFKNIANLQEISIRYFISLVDDDILNIVRNCSQITDIDITGCYSVTNNGLKLIATLQRLKCLRINYLPRISDIGLQDLKNLRVLECAECPLITDAGIISVLMSSPKLHFLKIALCTGITDMTYDIARQICDERSSKIVLHMDIWGTKINLRNKLDSPFLKIS